MYFILFILQVPLIIISGWLYSIIYRPLWRMGWELGETFYILVSFLCLLICHEITFIIASLIFKKAKAKGLVNSNKNINTIELNFKFSRFSFGCAIILMIMDKFTKPSFLDLYGTYGIIYLLTGISSLLIGWWLRLGEKAKMRELEEDNRKNLE